MIDYDRFIKELGPCYQLHIEAHGGTPERLHRLYINDFFKAMRLRPIKVETVDHFTQRIITRMHPLVAMTKLLTAYPKQIQSFRFGLSHTVYMTPSIDEDDYFESDPMPFRYKRITRFQPISFHHNNM